MGVKRAAVWQIDPKFRTATHDTPWVAEVLNDGDARPRRMDYPVVLRIISPDEREYFPTHAEALAYALHEVGLATAGHSTYIQEAGDGWSEPMEAWCVCSCGAHVWSWMQTGEPGGAIDGPHGGPWDSWRAHLTEVGLTPTNPEPMEAP